MFVTDGYISLLDVILIEMFVDDAHHTLKSLIRIQYLCSCLICC